MNPTFLSVSGILAAPGKSGLLLADHSISPMTAPSGTVWPLAGMPSLNALIITGFPTIALTPQSSWLGAITCHASENAVPFGDLRVPELDFFDDKEGKPAAIQKFIGRRPIAAFGNSDGDLQMLQWTAAGPGRRLMVLVDHTDAEREFDYRISPMGRLEVALTEAHQRDWTVVRMKDDWKRIFAFE